MGTLEPGLYKATVRGVPDTVVMVQDDGDCFSVSQIDHYWGHTEAVIKDARPLIVLNFGEPAEAVMALRSAAEFVRHNVAQNLIINGIANLIEEQTKRPRIPEPGLWGVVRASLDDNTASVTWVRMEADNERCWSRGWSGWSRRPWADLVNPVLVRDGVSP
jgi:hypothetical protein